MNVKQTLDCPLIFRLPYNVAFACNLTYCQGDPRLAGRRHSILVIPRGPLGIARAVPQRAHRLMDDLMMAVVMMQSTGSADTDPENQMKGTSSIGP